MSVRDRVVRPSLKAIQSVRLIRWVRQSLFAIPSIGILLGVGLAELLIRVEDPSVLDGLMGEFGTTAANARAMLTAIASGMITVVTLLLTLTLVAVQLAAGQLSPRTIADFLDDRFQQVTIGLGLATAAYSLGALRGVRPEAVDGASTPDVLVLGAAILTLGSLLFLVGSVDRIASRLQVGNLIDDLAEQTEALVDVRFAASAADGDLTPRPHDAEPWQTGASISTDTSGWIQYVDHAALRDALPDDSRARVAHRVGSFVFADQVLVELETEDAGSAASIRHAIVIGDSRTMQQDVAYGLTRLVDIGLRALSPGINDPNTAIEVAHRLGQIVLRLMGSDLIRPHDGASFEMIEWATEPDHEAFVTLAFDQMLESAADSASVLDAMRTVLSTIRDEILRRELPGDVAPIEAMLTRVDQALDRRIAARS